MEINTWRQSKIDIETRNSSALIGSIGAFKNISMNETQIAQISKQVWIYSPKMAQWHLGPSLPENFKKITDKVSRIQVGFDHFYFIGVGFGNNSYILKFNGSWAKVFELEGQVRKQLAVLVKNENLPEC